MSNAAIVPIRPDEPEERRALVERRAEFQVELNRLNRAEHLRQEAQQKLRALAAEIAAIDRAEGEAWKTWLERSAFCRSKTSRPSRSRMRNATVLGGNVRLAAAMTASDTSSPCTSTSPKINSPCSGAAPTNWIRNGCGFAERMRCSSSSGAA